LLGHLFGLHPWDVDRLTVGQFEAYKSFADSWRKSQEG